MAAAPVVTTFVRWQRAAMIAIVSIVVGLAVANYLIHKPEKFVDFRAFYCGGEVARAGADPYLEHPLHECEQRVALPSLVTRRNDATIPVPFPGFVFVVFELFAGLPFVAGLVAWTVASVVALGAGTMLVARTTNIPILASLIAIGFPAAIVALPLGQVTPFILLALSLCAALLQSGRPRLAVLASLGTLLDPHVGLALIVALAIGVPRSRGVLCVGIGGLIVVGLLVRGLGSEIEYLRSVLPAHALANVTDSEQFSVTNLAFLAGASPAVAVAIGSSWYLGALVVGLVVATRLRASWGVASIVYVPVAFVVFGGTHTHFQQLGLATPAFLLLCSKAIGPRRDLCAAATYAAIMPWLFLAPYTPFCLAAPMIGVVFAGRMDSSRQALRIAAASLVTMVLIALTIVRTLVARAPQRIVVHGNPLAEVSWQASVIASNVPTEIWKLVAKTPTMVAFVVLFIVLVRSALGPPPLPQC